MLLTPLLVWTPPLSPESKRQNRLVILSGSLPSGRVRHVADHPERAVLADLPPRRGGVGPGAVDEVDRLAEDVGERLVHRPGLVLVDERRLELGHAVGHLVTHDVVRADALADEHLAEGRRRERAPVGVGERARVRERRRVRRRRVRRVVAPANRRLHRHAGAVDAVAGPARVVEVVGVAEEVVDRLDIGDGAAVGAALVQHRCRGGAVGVGVADVVVVADRAVEGVLDQLEGLHDLTGVRIDEHPLDDPGLSRRIDLEAADEARAAVGTVEPRVVHVETLVGAIEVGAGSPGPIGDGRDRSLGGLLASRRRDRCPAR